jgi:hypothetical protein
MYGSPTLMRTLAAHDLVDEYKLGVHPIVLGGGKRLFAAGFDKSSLELVDVKSLSTGVVILTYRPARSSTHAIGPRRSPARHARRYEDTSCFPGLMNTAERGER